MANNDLIDGIRFGAQLNTFSWVYTTLRTENMVRLENYDKLVFNWQYYGVAGWMANVKKNITVVQWPM